MVTVALDGTDVRLSWNAPNDNFSTITAYKVELQKHDNTWVTDLTNCDASQGSVFSSKTCIIPMIEIAPLTSLTIDDPIKAKVSA